MTTERQLIFLFGTQKSGTTWLRNIVGDLVPIERHAEWYFPALVEALETHFLRYSNHSGDEKMALLSANVLSVWKSLIGSCGESSFADKSAYPCTAENGARDELFPYAADMKRFYAKGSCRILIVRDPRDVLVSAKYFFERAHLDFHDDYLSRFLTGWSRCNLHWAAAQPTCILRYEDLKADFAAQCARLLEACQLELSHARFAEICGRHATIDAIRPSNPRFYRKGIVGDWKNELTAEQGRLAWQVGGDAMRIFGYEEAGQVIDQARGIDIFQDTVEIPLRWLLWQQWTGAAAALTLDGRAMEVKVNGSDAALVFEAAFLPSLGVEEKLVLMLEVAWDRHWLEGDERPYFDRRLGSAQGAEFSLAQVTSKNHPTAHQMKRGVIFARSQLYGTRSIVCFELADPAAAGVRLQIQLFNGRFREAFSGFIHSLRWRRVGTGSQFANQIGDLKIAGPTAAAC